MENPGATEPPGTSRVVSPVHVGPEDGFSMGHAG